MKAENFDLDKYFSRINFDGSQFTPHIESIQNLMRKQLFAIPFENLDVLSGKGVSMEPEDIVSKIVNNERGGYCYELNGIFAMTLQHLNIPYYFVAARPMFYPVKRPKTHMGIITTLEGKKWFLDLGFGSYGIRAPIALDNLNDELTQDYDKFKLSIIENGDYLVSAMIDDKWIKQFAFTDTPVDWIDFSPVNYLNSTHPDAIFTQKNVIISHNENGRNILLGNRLKTISCGTTSETEIPPIEINSVLADVFNLHLQ